MTKKFCLWAYNCIKSSYLLKLFKKKIISGLILINLLIPVILYSEPADNINGLLKTDDNKIVFFISPTGSDNWSGKLAEPNALKNDGPFATLERARDAVRQLRYSEDVKVPVYVQLREGTYYLDKTFILKPEDSGTG
jgi:hypothetical protein